MAGGLKLHVTKYFQTGGTPSQGAVANVYALDPSKKTSTQRNILVPVGAGPESSPVALEPGRYLVEVVLPSGDILSREVTSVEGQWSDVDLEIAPSAHEWHAWPHLLGYVQSADSYKRQPSFAPRPPLNVYDIRQPAPELQNGPGARDVWKLLPELIAAKPVEAQVLTRIAPGGWLLPATSDRDENTQVQTFLPGPPGLPMQALPRRYALVSNPAASAMTLASLPAPWYSLSNGQEVPIELLIRRSETESFEVNFSVLDQNIGTALAYMARGALQSALQFVDHDFARAMLYDKWINPLGAAAGGYLLLGTEKDMTPKPWHQWIQNVSNKFPWLPDGPIQMAWHWLKRGSQPDNLVQARQALLMAYKRGLPYYAVGLQWMIDGLTLLGEDDAEAAEMLRTVQRVAWRVDMSQPFTTVALVR